MAEDPIQVAPDYYRVVFENERVRVLAFHAGPGASWGLHAHPDAVVVSLNDYRVRNVVPGTEPTVREARWGDIAWIPARSHTGENVGDSEMDCVLIELKEPVPQGARDLEK
jgi:quercetin dioxygenase-like cupin family protein